MKRLISTISLIILISNLIIGLSLTPALAQSAPTVTTDAASAVNGKGAILNGAVNANGYITIVTFEYGVTTAYGTKVTAYQSPVIGSISTAVSTKISDLLPNVTYHFRVVATNANGTTNGSDMTFTTDPKSDAPGKNKEPGEPANGKAHGKDDAPGKNKEPGEPANGKASGKDCLGNVTIYEYDVDGNLISITDPLGNTTTYTYDSSGNKLTETDPLGNTTTYTYDTAGNLILITDPDGYVTAYTYDALGNMVSKTDAFGDVTTYIYDANGRLISETDPLGKTTTYTYDAAGNLISIT